VEGFWGGSHRAAAEGWAERSRHEICLLHLPARFWKWRMRGAAFAFARELRSREEAGLAPPDLLFATNMVDVAHLRALLSRRTAAVLYFHENQASYPTPLDREVPERDLGYAFTDLAGALAADRVAFNSASQRDAFFREMETLIRRMPDARPLWALDEVRSKSLVLPLGIRLDDFPPVPPRDGAPPLVVWNHRWEWDKDPETFFRVLGRLAERDVPFRVAVAGEGYRRAPPVFREARAALGERVIHWGNLSDRAAYLRLLCRGDVAVSTARHETFGISLVEAAFAGAHPLAPRALSYPEILPPQLHGRCLYAGEADLEARLEALLTGRTAPVASDALRALLRRHDWGERAREWDDFAARAAGDAGVP
jgi:glycosyltransferase involved in cell wall biosynthesis